MDPSIAVQVPLDMSIQCTRNSSKLWRITQAFPLSRIPPMLPTIWALDLLPVPLTRLPENEATLHL